MSEENVEIVKHGYAAFREAWTTNDRAAYEAWLRDAAAPEFEYFPSAKILGGPTGRLNVEGFLDFLDTFWEEFEVLIAEPSEILDAGDNVIARVNFRGRGRHSRLEIGLDQFQVWTFRDGKAVRGEAFEDRAEALEVAGLSE
jgi:ketosteroid isomerase-like protein